MEQREEEVPKGTDKGEDEKVVGDAAHGERSDPSDADSCEADRDKTEEESKEQEGGSGLTDKEFDDLLDNALSDFLVDPPSKNDKEKSECDDPVATNKSEEATSIPNSNSKFKLDDFETIFEEIKKMDLAGDSNCDSMMETLTKMTKKHDSTGEEPEMKYIVETVLDTVKNMSESAQNLQVDEGGPDLVDMILEDDAYVDLPPEELAEMMVPPEDLARAREMNLNPFIMRLISMCLSKSILYPPLQNLLSQFPEWLAANEATLSADEYNRRVQQLDLIKRICDEFEKEQPTDSEAVKTERFKILLDLMKQLKEYGQPPAGLLGGLPLPPFQLDMAGMPNIGNVPDDDNCCIM